MRDKKLLQSVRDITRQNLLKVCQETITKGDRY